MNGTYTQRRRTQMAGGGITTLPRQNYGIGSWVKERVRKIIPKEVAKVAQVAAPFVAPFNPIAGGLMAGLGGFQQTGRMGQSLKSGLGTYGLGQAARYIGGAGVQKGWQNPLSAGSYSVPWGTQTGLGKMFAGGADASGIRTVADQPISDFPFLDKTKYYKAPEVQESMFQKITDFVAKPFEKLGKLGKGQAMLTVGAIGTGLSLVADKLVGPKDPGETMQEYMTRRKSTMSEYLRYYYKNVNPLASEEEVANFVATNTREYSSQGGRIGYKHGSGLESLDAGAPSITYEGDMRAIEGQQASTMSTSMIELISYLETLPFDKKLRALEMLPPEIRAEVEARLGLAQGGRIGYYGGGMGLPTIPGIPRMAPDGLEYDMSQHGGFQPLGAQEGKDDVKANLAKNEFVFTADAVRGAGDGDIETGAQRMYDTMKRLEGRVA